MTLSSALDGLRNGKFVVLFDSSKREGEADLLLAAQHATPGRIAAMRKHAGGLMCVAIGEQAAEALELPFLEDVLSEAKSVNASIILRRAKYGDKSAFSLSVNHMDTFTGVTDADRALTMREVARIASMANGSRRAASLFAKVMKSPGHVQLLRSRGIKNRHGHTELATALAELAGIVPAVALCEVLDPRSGRAMSLERSRALSKALKAEFLEGKDVLAKVGE